ncbi:MAG: TIGR03862 family flavoprotein [bacterium]
MKRIAIIGGGPAGLRAAESASTGEVEVTLFDAKPSVGRKFLVAGKGGLNLTHSESLENFAKRYSSTTSEKDFWPSLLSEFPPQELREWAKSLGAETFAAGSGRVYLKTLKAAALLRAWVARLRKFGVRFEMNHRLVSINPSDPIELGFSNGATPQANAVILAMGGGSWPRTGSDGEWVKLFSSLGIGTNPLSAANCGWECDWDPGFLAIAEGKPLKNVTVQANGHTVTGELLITRYGVEGGPIYTLGRTLRGMTAPAVQIDLKPAHTQEQLVAKMESVRRNFAAEARQRWKLSDAGYALLARSEWGEVRSIACEAKCCTLALKRPRPLAEAISSAGGVCWQEIDDTLMVKKVPGLFVAGEMIDWEAPTGGYLLQGCFATGSRAAKSALAWVNQTGDRQ